MPVQGSIDSLKQVENNTDKNRVYEQVEKMPQFPGGEKALLDYISRNMRYPTEASRYGIQGKIVVEFIINELGKVSDVSVLHGIDPDIDYEGLRVISSLPDWLPGEENGKKVSVRYTIPLTFRLEVDKSLRPAAILDGKLLPIDFDIKKLNKDSVESVFVIKPDQREKLAELAKKYKTNTSNGVFILVSKTFARQHVSDKVPASDEKVFDIVEQIPQFPGGEKALLSFIANNLKYPVEAQTNGIQGKVFLRFVISSLGKTTKIEVVKSIDPALDKEAVRVVESLPDWIPGKQNGVNVNVYYTLPVSFKLNSSKENNHNNADRPVSVIILPPKFPGGPEALNNFVMKNMQYPEDAKQSGIQGTVNVRFVVNAEGKVENPQIDHSISTGLDKEALRITNLLPNFTPGTRNGVNASIDYVLPIVFKLNYKLKSQRVDSTKQVRSNASQEVQINNIKPIPISADSIRKERQSLEKPDKDGIYQMAEKMPQFPGGEKALLEYINQHLKYPRIAQRNGIQGVVVIRFVVSENGNVKNVNVLRGFDADCDYEALRVITNLPNFIPAEQKGEKVSVYFTIPIMFRLN